MVGFLGIAAVRGLHHPVLAGYVNRRIESPRRATVLSVQNLMGNVVMAVVWPLAGVVADGSGLRAVFLMYAFGTLAVGGGALLLWDRAEHRTADSERWLDASKRVPSSVGSQANRQSPRSGPAAAITARISG